MKLVCPFKGCSKVVNIGDESRFEYFSCSEGHKFRGLQADVYHNILDKIFSIAYLLPVQPPQLEPEDQTPCPFCLGMIDLKKIKESGYYGPKICKYCCGNLN